MWQKSCDKSTFMVISQNFWLRCLELFLRYILLRIMKSEFRENWTKLLVDNQSTVFYVL